MEVFAKKSTENGIFQLENILQMIGTTGCLYLLAPSLDRRVGFMISLAFALLNIFAARLLVDFRHWHRATAYIFLSVSTYFLLFSNEPWDFLFQAGMFDASPVPLVICSLVMTLAGWLLLKGWKARILYFFITLGIQIPIGFLVGISQTQSLFADFSNLLGYSDFYLDSWAFWQLEWMINYHLPFYFLSRLEEESPKL